jgi:hypothetical protein
VAAATGSSWWRLWFRAVYHLIRLLDPLIRRWWAARLPGLERIVDLHLVGRRTGRSRHILVTLLTVDGQWYVGHPNGDAGWTHNLASARDPRPRLSFADGGSVSVTAARLPTGSERDAVIRATWSQQPFPANLMYRLARRHTAAVGVYFRLLPSS